MTLKEQLIRDEGLRLHPYKDSVGKLTVGVGRNLDDVGISQPEAEYLLNNDILDATNRLEQALPWTAGLEEVRLAVLINMAFNMGVGALLGFRKFLADVQGGDYQSASQEMLNSKWAEQVGPRAHRLALQMEGGAWQ